jgi:hypothetical protein
MVKIRFGILFILAALLLGSCGIFKKKCNCPDLRKSKHIAEIWAQETIVIA